MTDTLTLIIPRTMWLTANGRYHWAAKASRTKALRGLAREAATAAGLTHHDRLVHVEVAIAGRTRVRTDPLNVSPTVKAIIDGLTDAGVWDDDDSRHLVGPDLRADTPDRDLPVGTHRLTITITPLEQ